MNFGTLHTTQIYVMRRDGSNVRRISASSGIAGSPAWSPDSFRIVYSHTAVAEILKVLAPPGSVNLVLPDNSRDRARG
jgi:Tol biopolymer transport system component